MNISLEFIENISEEKDLNSIELKILRCIFEENANSIKEIQEKIKIKSYAATQKKLAGIYEKFKINKEVSGPGKFYELKKTIEAIYFERYRIKKVILFWNSRDEYETAKAFKNIVLKDIKLDVEIANEDVINLVSKRNENRQECLYIYDIGIIFWTQEPSYTAIFYAGFLASKMKGLKIAINNGFISSMPNMEVINLNKKEDVRIIINELINDKEVAFLLLDSVFDEWLLYLKALDKNAVEKQKDYLFSNRDIFLLRNKDLFLQNPCLELLCTYFDFNVNFYMEQFLKRSAFLLPTLRYYEFLYSIQKMKEGKIIIKSTLFLSESETILRADIDDKIIANNQNSQRIFIYTNQDEILRNIQIIAKHANYYNVFIMDIKEFYRSHEEIIKDGLNYINPRKESFVILDYESAKVVGTNVETLDTDYFYSQVMSFYTDDKMIYTYQRWMDLITKQHDLNKSYSIKIQSSYQNAIKQLTEIVAIISRNSNSLVTGS